jgi:flagellar motor switch protein FliG
MVGKNDKELAAALSAADVQTAAAGLLFSTPNRAARLFNIIENYAPEELINQMTAIRDLGREDAETLVTRLRDVVGTADRANGFALTRHLATLLEQAETGKRDAVTLVLERDETLMKAVRAPVLTLADVLALDRDVVAELINALENEDLAALVIALPQDKQRMIASFLSQRGIKMLKAMVSEGSIELNFGDNSRQKIPEAS